MTIRKTHSSGYCNRFASFSSGPDSAETAKYRAQVWDLTLKSFSLKKRFYIVLVSRDEDGSLRKVPLPLHYAYVFVAAAVIGAFTIAGLAGSYSRMLIKTARFNQLRDDRDTLQKNYAHLERQAHEKDVQAASLSSLASEVSALYGLTASKLAVPMGHMRLKSASKAPGAKASSRMDFQHEDRADPRVLNVILWRDAMGKRPIPEMLQKP